MENIPTTYGKEEPGIEKSSGKEVMNESSSLRQMAIVGFTQVRCWEVVMGLRFLCVQSLESLCRLLTPYQIKKKNTSRVIRKHEKS